MKQKQHKQAERSKCILISHAFDKIQTMAEGANCAMRVDMVRNVLVTSVSPPRCRHCFVPEVLHALANLAEARDGRRRRWFGNLFFSWDGWGGALPDRERGTIFCGLLMSHTDSPDVCTPKEFQHDDLSQLRNALRHLTRGFLGCLAAEEVGDTWRFITRPNTSKPTHEGISSCKHGEADMVGRILATLVFLHFLHHATRC